MDTPASHRPAPWVRGVIVVALSIGAVMVEGYVLTRHEPTAMGPRAEAAFSVLSGTPRWRAYQNRLLGPQLVRGIQVLSGAGNVASLKAFFWLAVVAKWLAVYLLFKRLASRAWIAASVAAAASLMTVGCLGFWVYPWDYLDAIFMSLLLLGIVGGRGWRWFGALFLFGLWNRETVLFLPLWFLIDSVTLRRADPIGRASFQIDLPQCFGAAWLLALGAGVISVVRQVLFIHLSDGASDALDLQHASLGNHLLLLRNAREFVTEFRVLGQDPPGRARLISGGIILLLAVALVYQGRLTVQGRKLLIWSACVAIGTVTFGAINEARIWIGFVPICLFWVAVFGGFVDGATSMRRAAPPPAV